jgi:hypothetical protein
MKYWKQFWGGLNQGWKRIHYVVLGLQILVCFAASKGMADNLIANLVISYIVIPTAYYLLITAIYWIKEGFEPKAPTEEE